MGRNSSSLSHTITSLGLDDSLFSLRFSRSSVPVANPASANQRSLDSHTGAASLSHPLHLFDSPLFYPATSSSSLTPSGQSHAGIVPVSSYRSSLAAATSTHRQTKQALPMSTESDTDPENSLTSHDIISDPTFLRAAAAAAAASGGSASTALFHTLSGRVHHLMNRSGAGSSLSGRFQQYIQGIQVTTDDLNERNEDFLSSRPIRKFD